MRPREQGDMLLRKAAADEALVEKVIEDPLQVGAFDRKMAREFIRRLRVWVEAELKHS
jgi:hypothetical protein